MNTAPVGMPLRPQRRKGHDWLKLLCVLLLVGAALLATDGLLNPYSFLLGGHLHPLPGWQGAGWMHSNGAGGDYWLYVHMTPSPNGGRIIPQSALKGFGFLCTPRGERIRLKVSASMAFRLPSNTAGQPIGIHLYGWKPGQRLFGTIDHRPRVELHGVWGERELVVQDHGTLEKAFLPDGTVAPLPLNRANGANITGTLNETPWWEFMPGCPAR